MLNWLRKLLHRKSKEKVAFSLTNEQFRILQRLSGYYLLRQEDIVKEFPEISIELGKFYNTEGVGWKWFPKEVNGYFTSELSERPERYDVNERIIVEGDIEYKLAELGIIAKNGNEVIRRAKLLPEYKVKDSDNYLDFLSSI